MTVGTANSDTVTYRDGKFYVEKGEDLSMRVPGDVLKGIAFIGMTAGKDESGTEYGDILGTGFFVSVRSQRFSPPSGFLYLVTARHVIDELQGSDPFIRVNGLDGKAAPIKNIGPKWWLHPTDKTADVAVLQVGYQSNFAAFAAKIEDFVTPEDVDAGLVVEGDEILMAGYFSPVESNRNIPIVRHGNVAMLPGEQIQTGYGYADVYLVEARSLGGISGSPVLVRSTIRYGIEMPKGSTAYFDAVGRTKLLGLMHGHWDVREEKKNDPKIEHDRKHGVNLGIGIVVPAVKILETLNQPELVELRRLGDEEKAKQSKSIPGMDSARPKSDEETTFGKEDFEAALKKVTRKVPKK